ncbi:MAG: hypothetical protein OXQ29_10330 [Rhodospirillaceae bacterium]|nr:hypothetical protein [Rhodospirillaceae bacterium]
MNDSVKGAVALKILDLVDGFDDPMVEGVCDWLEQTADATGGVPFVLPSANDYPHAPWCEAPPEPPPPLDWAPAPTGFGHRLFTRDQLNEGLTALANAQRDDGGWPIKWPAISPGVELEWRGRVTIDALLTLRAYAMAGYGAA